MSEDTYFERLNEQGEIIASEEPEWMEDSDRIFTALTSGGFTTFAEAQQAIVMLYVPDMSFSRAGISHALKRLEKHFAETELG